MKTISASISMKGMPSESLRFIALSASVPNLEDIAAWLNISFPQAIKLYAAYVTLKTSVTDSSLLASLRTIDQ